MDCGQVGGEDEGRQQALPPSPLAVGESPAEGSDALLPWCTPAAVMAAALTVHVASGTVLRLYHDDRVPFWLVHIWGIGLTGLGAVLADRLLPRWRRPWRWAVGVGAIGLVPVATLVYQIGPHPLRWGWQLRTVLSHEVLGFGIGCACTGWLLGWAAGSKWPVPATAAAGVGAFVGGGLAFYLVFLRLAFMHVPVAAFWSYTRLAGNSDGEPVWLPVLGAALGATLGLLIMVAERGRDGHA